LRLFLLNRYVLSGKGKKYLKFACNFKLFVISKNTGNTNKNIETLKELVSSLSHENRANYGEIFNSISIPVSDFLKSSSFSKEKYTRITLFENEHYELKLLCWESGQQTPIHDHGGEECWVKFIKGCFHETIYKVSENERIELINQVEPQEGQTTYMIDFFGFHRLKNNGRDRGMSLHLYAKPVNVCQVYDEETKQILTRNYE